MLCVKSDPAVTFSLFTNWFLFLAKMYTYKGPQCMETILCGLILQLGDKVIIGL